MKAGKLYEQAKAVSFYEKQGFKICYWQFEKKI